MSTLQRRHIKRCLNRTDRQFVLVMILLSLIATSRWKGSKTGRGMVSNSEIPYKVTGNPGISPKNKRNKPEKFLSYQPPGGGWNNQRIAFENAVIMAAMLKRTLLVQPLAPHGRILQVKTQYNQSAGYAIYNMLKAEELIPISNLIDVDRLSSLTPVQEVISNHDNFRRKYNASSWFMVCHNGLIRPWVDKIPFGFNRTVSNFTFTKFRHNFHRRDGIAKYRQVCPQETELGMWQFLPELRKRQEDIIYFEKGSLFVRNIFFTDYERALSSQKAVIDWIRPAPKVLYNTARIIHAIKRPFNAIHVRRTDHKTGQGLTIQHWLSRLAKAHARRYSKTLYIATDETNLTWFSPLKETGYKLLFAHDLEIFRKILKNNPITGEDMIGFHEQVICSCAKVFIGSYYSTFSWVIERSRQAEVWNRKYFRNFIFSSVRWLNI